MSLEHKANRLLRALSESRRSGVAPAPPGRTGSGLTRDEVKEMRAQLRELAIEEAARQRSRAAAWRWIERAVLPIATILIERLLSH